jgi:5-(carboxyamino)imidazole ribonucleotide synthase
MLALEARRMGYHTLVLDPAPHCPAAQVADDHIAAPLGDGNALRELLRRSDVVTWEWENADVDALRELEAAAPLRPAPGVLAIAQHRVKEKQAVRRLGIPTARFRPVSDRASLDAALAEIGIPAVLKSARGGYDGRGQARIRTLADADTAFAGLARPGGEWVLEAWVPFRAEISVVCARSAAGEIAAFPAAENVHEDGVLDLTLAPARVSGGVGREARRIAEALVEGLDVVGLLGVEMFVDAEERVLVNEVAPRPHNSGHFTWEGCAVSQFEQQIRAVCGLPLGSVELRRPAAMANLLGRHLGAGWPGAVPALLGEPDVALHWYGKDEIRPGRKMGHLTALAPDVEAARERVLRARNTLAGDLQAVIGVL